MHFFKSYKIKLQFYSLLFLISITPFVFSIVSILKNTYNKELLNVELSNFKSIKNVTAHIDGIYSATHASPEIDTLHYVKITSDVVKKRFYHGLSEYSIIDNWITYICGHLFWGHLNAKVDPEDILDNPYGLCSQQTIVFLEILKLKGIKTRWVGLGHKQGPGHFLAEVYYYGKWHLYDVNLEPKWEKITNHHESIAYYKQYPDSLFLAYEGIISRFQYDKIMEKVKYGEVNEFPAKKMLLFHRITLFLTYFFPIIFLMLFFKTRYTQLKIKT